MLAADESGVHKGCLPALSPRPGSTPLQGRLFGQQCLGPSRSAGDSTDGDTEGGADDGAGGEEGQQLQVAEVTCRLAVDRQTIRDAPTAGGLQLLNSLVDDNRRLHGQVLEMEAFLKDHGLVWVGSGQVSGDQRWRRERPTSAELDNILCTIHELNGEITRENLRCVAPTRGGAKFQATRSLHLVFYADGIVVEDGNVRPYSDRATKSFLADLRDGFFPSEFKISNPDGLLIHATDNRKKESSDALPSIRRRKERITIPFAGKGHRLGVYAREPDVSSEDDVESWGGEGQVTLSEMSSENLTRELSTPRRPREAQIQAREQHSLPPLGGDGYRRGKEHVSGCPVNKEAVVRVRLAPTELKMEFRMGFKETVKQLGHLIARRIREYSRAGQGTHSSYRDILTNLKELATGNALLSSFEIRLPYLNDKIIDVEQTIEEAGLTPSAVVVFRRRETRAQRGL